jgi:hypothetical protein
MKPEHFTGLNCLFFTVHQHWYRLHSLSHIGVIIPYMAVRRSTALNKRHHLPGPYYPLVTISTVPRPYDIVRAYKGMEPIPVAARSLGSWVRIPLGGMDVFLLCLYVMLSSVGRGPCDGLITRPEESYRVSNCMCDHRNPEKGGQRSILDYKRL